jgi:hypothetical protein
MTAPRISACIVCRNEADRLAACLESIAWADEIVVLDLESSDGSADVARQRGARVVTHAHVPIVERVRNTVADAASGDWILVLDPDERILPALAAELRRAAARDDIDAVVMPRMNCDFGHAPSNPRERFEPQLRMYRRARVRWPELPNALPVVAEERLARIAARDELVIVHERSRNIVEVLDRSVRYAPAQAQAMLDRGEAFSARAMLLDLGRRTYRQLVQGRAWRDGVPGLVRVGVLVGFHFHVWVALWQLTGAVRTPEDDRTVRRLAVLLAPLRALLHTAEKATSGLRRLRGRRKPSS